MSFGKRRPKLSRAQLRPTNPIAIQQGRLARQRARRARLAVVATAVLVTAAIVHGSGTPFPYRLGQRPSRELRVNVPEFHRLNQKKTNAARQMVVDQVATSMINDPASIRDLAGRLVELTVAVVSAPRFEDLTAGLRNAWKLDQATFDELKAATDTPARRDALRRQIEAAFAPLIRDGVLGPDTLPRNEEASRNLSVRLLGQAPREAHPVPRERVVPERIAQPDGPVAQEFVAALPPQIGATLFRLVADRLKGSPTLTFDEPTTTQQRELARNSVKEILDIYRQGHVLVEQDQEINEELLILLRMEHETANAMLGPGALLRRALSIVVLVAALFALIGYYIHRHEPEIARDLGRISALCALVIAA